MNKTDLGNSLNEKIEDLNLIALRKYACPKVSGQTEWYLKCLECPGIEDCACGRRVRDILEDQTKPGKQAVLASTMAGELRISKARSRVEEIFKGCKTDEDKIVAVLRGNKPNILCSSAYNNALNWKCNYPDLEEKYRFITCLRPLNRDEYRTRKVGDVLKEFLEKQEQNNENDQVSIDDFLKETAAEVTRQESAPVMAEPVLKAEAPAKADPPAGQEAVRSEFQKKKTEYLRKLAEVEALRAELTRKIKLLDETAALFGLRPKN